MVLFFACDLEQFDNNKETLNPEETKISEESTLFTFDNESNVYVFETNDKKYLTPIGTVFEGCQFVYDSKGNLVTDSLNQGTFDTKSPNSFIGKVKHFASDVIPWLKWGNGTANNQVMPPGLQASIENVLNDFNAGNITKDTAKNEIENIVRSFKESQND